MKVCSTCGQESGPNAKFCYSCGSPALTSADQVCSSCGHECSSAHKFCNNCGSQLQVRAPNVEARQENPQQTGNSLTIKAPEGSEPATLAEASEDSASVMNSRASVARASVAIKASTAVARESRLQDLPNSKASIRFNAASSPGGSPRDTSEPAASRSTKRHQTVIVPKAKSRPTTHGNASRQYKSMTPGSRAAAAAKHSASASEPQDKSKTGSRLSSPKKMSHGAADKTTTRKPSASIGAEAARQSFKQRSSRQSTRRPSSRRSAQSQSDRSGSDSNDGRSD